MDCYRLFSDKPEESISLTVKKEKQGGSYSISKSSKTYSRKNKGTSKKVNGHTSDNSSDEDTPNVKIIGNTKLKTDPSESNKPPIKLKISLSPDKSAEGGVTLYSKTSTTKLTVQSLDLSPSKVPVYTPPSHTRSSRVVKPSKRVLESIVDQSEERERKLRKLDNGQKATSDIHSVPQVTTPSKTVTLGDSESPPDSWVEKVKSSSKVKELTSSAVKVDDEIIFTDNSGVRKTSPFDSDEDDVTITPVKVAGSVLTDEGHSSFNEPKLVLQKMPEFIDPSAPEDNTAASTEGRSVSSLRT